MNWHLSLVCLAFASRQIPGVLRCPGARQDVFAVLLR